MVNNSYPHYPQADRCKFEALTCLSNHEDEMKNTPFVVDVRPVRSEMISPEEYLKLSKDSPGLIERAKFVPPRIGVVGYGSFLVQYARSRHRALAHG